MPWHTLHPPTAEGQCMRISLITGLNNGSPVESCIRELTQARDEGFARLWMTQMPYDVDLLTVLAAALPEVPGIEVASGVVPIQNQHPTLLAQRALTLNIIGDGRFTLGIGVTHRAVTEGMWGVSWDRSVKSEYLDGLLPLLAKSRSTRPASSSQPGERCRSRTPRRPRCTSPRWVRRCCGSPVGAPREPSHG